MERSAPSDGSGADLLVDQVEAETRSSALELGDPAGDLLDGVHLLVQEVGLEEVAEMSVAVGSLVEVEKTLVDLGKDGSSF